MASLKKNKCAMFAMGALLGLAGCTPEIHRYIHTPEFVHPGYARDQRNDAIVHDPYPLNDVGPEIVGGRPLSYQQPVPEVARARMNARPPVVYIPGPPMPAAAPQAVPPPIVTAPFPATPAPASAPAPYNPVQAQPRSPY